MIEQNFLALTNQEKDDTLTRRQLLGIALGLIGNGLLLLGHFKNTKKLVQKVVK